MLQLTVFFFGFFQADLDLLLKITGLLTSIGTVLAIITTVVWYVWRGQSQQQLETSLKAAESLIATLDKSINQMQHRISELDANVLRLRGERDNCRHEQEETRMLNLRLQGRVTKLEKQLGIFDSE